VKLAVQFNRDAVTASAKAAIAKAKMARRTLFDSGRRRLANGTKAGLGDFFIDWRIVAANYCWKKDHLSGKLGQPPGPAQQGSGSQQECQNG